MLCKIDGGATKGARDLEHNIAVDVTTSTQDDVQRGLIVALQQCAPRGFRAGPSLAHLAACHINSRQPLTNTRGTPVSKAEPQPFMLLVQERPKD